jgi:hypothetical protein
MLCYVTEHASTTREREKTLLCIAVRETTLCVHHHCEIQLYAFVRIQIHAALV